MLLSLDYHKITGDLVSSGPLETACRGRHIPPPGMPPFKGSQFHRFPGSLPSLLPLENRSLLKLACHSLVTRLYHSHASAPSLAHANLLANGSPGYSDAEQEVGRVRRGCVAIHGAIHW